MSVTAYLTPDLVIYTYRGSPIKFTIQPLLGGVAIADLPSYDQIEFSLWTGTREAPGTKQLTIKFKGVAPNYISVVDVDAGVGVSYAAQIDIPDTVSLALPVASYFAELWITPPGGKATFTGFAYWHHLPTTAGA